VRNFDLKMGIIVSFVDKTVGYFAEKEDSDSSLAYFRSIDYFELALVDYFRKKKCPYICNNNSMLPRLRK
jgi:hypothetical protein